MNNKRTFVIGIVMSLVLIMLTACGGETTSSTKEARTAEKYNTVELGNMVFQIPNYYEGDSSAYYAEKGNKLTMISFSPMDVYSSESDFSANYQTLIDAALDGIVDGDGVSDFKDLGSKEIKTTSGIQASETDFEYNADYDENGNFVKMTGKMIVLNNPEYHKIVMAILLQSENSDYDYFDSFMTMINEAKIVAGSDSDKKSEDKAENSSSSIDPAFKKTMDDYEAWFDHYCEIMKKYKDNPSDMELMSEATELLSEEVDMLDDMNNMNQDEMTSAELKYYIDVTARIEKKLADVAF